MKKHRDLDNPVKFKPDYTWPKDGTKRACPKNNETKYYYAKTRDSSTMYFHT